MPSIPQWPERSFIKIDQSLEKIKRIREGSGKGSEKFTNVCRELLRLVITDRRENLYIYLKSPIYLRAYTHLLLYSTEFHEQTSIDGNVLDQFRTIKNPLSTLTLLQLILAFLKHFDHLKTASGLQPICNYIQEQLNGKQHKGGDISAYCQHGKLIFSLDGPQRIAAKAIEDHIDLTEQFRRLGLRGHEKGRYMFLCHTTYYLKTLEEIPVGKDDPILAELTKPEVFNAPYKEGRLIGHRALEILIDRSAGTQITSDWQNTILGIAGDPRVPKTDSKYQQWWELLGETRCALMRGWLSRFDLELFLKVLEQSARDAGNDEITRMFMPRKKFMEGLLSEKAISESRLFLCPAAERFLKRTCKGGELPSYAQVRSSQTSMIYINLGNKVHMLEGSHSFPVKLFKRLATTSPLNNYSVRRVEDHDLRSGEEHRYWLEHGSDGFLSQNHYDLKWQHEVLQFLQKQGISIPVSSVIRRESIRAYKNKYGA